MASDPVVIVAAAQGSGLDGPAVAAGNSKICHVLN